MRIRQAASPIQSEARALNVVDQNRWASATSGASRQRWPNSVMPDPRPGRTGRARVCCPQTSSIRLPNGSSNPISSPTRRDRASAVPPRHTVNPRLSSSVSASARAPGPSTVNAEAMTPETPSTNARQWCRESARRWATPGSPPSTSSSPTTSVAKRTAPARSAAPERT